MFRAFFIKKITIYEIVNLKENIKTQFLFNLLVFLLNKT